MSFRHIFRHWFNVCRSNLSARNAINVHLCRFSAYLGTKWHPKEMPDIAFLMRDMRRVSGIVSGSDLIFSGAIYRIRIAKNDHLYQFTIYFKYKWHLIEMPVIGLIFGQARLLTNSTIIFAIYKIYCTLNWPRMVINIELEWCQSPHHCQLNALLLCLLFVVCSYA